MILGLLLACGGAPVVVAPDPCAAAWGEAEAVRHGIDALGTNAVAPSQEAFLAACRMLPEDARPCMSPAWQIDHREPCRAALDAVPRDVRQRIDARLVQP